MKICCIKVDNYRSIKHVDLKLSKFAVFVGQNNHGKTNFFEAIQWFYTAKKPIMMKNVYNKTTKLLK